MSTSTIIDRPIEMMKYNYQNKIDLEFHKGAEPVTAAFRVCELFNRAAKTVRKTHQPVGIASPSDYVDINNRWNLEDGTEGLASPLILTYEDIQGHSDAWGKKALCFYLAVIGFHDEAIDSITYTLENYAGGEGHHYYNQVRNALVLKHASGLDSIANTFITRTMHNQMDALRNKR